MAGVIDIHTHLVPPSFLDRVRDGEFEGVAAVDGEQGIHLLWGERRSRPLNPGLLDLPSRLAYMRRQHIDLQVVSNWGGAFGYDLREEAAIRYSRAYNEEVARECRQSGRALRAMATVPLQSPERAAEVLEDAIVREGLHGVEIGTHVAGTELDDRALDPFWQAAADLHVPVVLHPIDVSGGDRLSSYYLTNLLGNPFDTTIAAARMMLGGVFDRHPGLSVVLLHGGGYTPMASGRLEHGRRVRPEPACCESVDHYLRHNLLVDTVVFDAETLRFIVGRMGPGRVLFGTDYPFDMAQDDGVAMVESTLDPSVQARVLASTSRSLFSL